MKNLTNGLGTLAFLLIVIGLCAPVSTAKDEKEKREEEAIEAFENFIEKLDAYREVL